MFFIFGSRLFGKVDEVPGYFYVATRFGHFNFVPLIPMGSYLVLSQKGSQWRGVPIPFHFKSLLVAWARAGGFVAILAGIVWALFSNRPDSLPGLTLATLGALAFYITKHQRWITHATPQRAIELAQLAGMPAQLIDRLRQDLDHGFEVIPTATSIRAEIPLEQPARMWFVNGVYRDSRQDACITILARDESEAKTLGETRGVEVTAVEPAGPAPSENLGLS